MTTVKLPNIDVEVADDETESKILEVFDAVIANGKIPVDPVLLNRVTFVALRELYKGRAVNRNLIRHQQIVTTAIGIVLTALIVVFGITHPGELAQFIGIH